MYILTILGREEEGAYSVIDEEGEKVLYIFVEEDDATRYAMMLEDSDYPTMNVMEVDDAILKTCQLYGYNYMIITEDDIVIPPEDSEQNDFI
jgi:hypothetical protein